MAIPLPPVNETSQPFWDGCANGVLRYQTCAHCGTVQLIPRTHCSACAHETLHWRDSSGYGQVLSHTTVHRAPTPAFRAQAPYIIVLVDMEEGFRLMCNADPDLAITVGTRVRIGFRPVEGVALPHVQECA